MKRHLKYILVALWLIAAPRTFAQSEVESRIFGAILQSQPETRVFEVKHVNLNRLNDVLSVFAAGQAAQIVPVQELGVISVRASKDVMNAIEAVIKQMDVPAPPKRAV